MKTTINTVNDTSISRLVDESTVYLKRRGCADQVITRWNLFYEEILRFYQERLGNDTPIEIESCKNLAKAELRIKFKGDSFNPLEEGDDIDLAIIRNLHAGFDTKPTWNYENGCNVITFIPLAYNSFWYNLGVTFKYAKPYRTQTGAALALQVLKFVLEIVLPLMTARLVVAYTDSVIQQILIMILVVFVIEAVIHILEYIFHCRFRDLSSDISREIIRDLVAGVFNTKINCIEDNGSGLFLQRITKDSEDLLDNFSNLAIQAGEVICNLGILVAMFVIDWKAGLITLVCFATILLLEVKRTAKLAELDTEYRVISESFSSGVCEIIRGTKDIRTLNCRGALLGGITDRINARLDALNERDHTDARGASVRALWDTVWHLVFLLYLCASIWAGALTPVIAIVLYNYRTEIRTTPVCAGAMIQCMRQFNLAAGRIYALIYSPDFAKESFGKLRKKTLNGDIEFKNVRFSYSTNALTKTATQVLRGVSFHVEAGETIAILGKSGCGKSSILSLIDKLYEPTAGTITIDGVDISEYDRSTIRNNVILLSQRPYIFNFTIRENLDLVRLGATDEEIFKACRAACIHDDIMKLTHGYDTAVGEGALELSGGQCQRLAIARGLLRGGSILLLDESMSELDKTTQRTILKNIMAEYEDKTVFVVSHRMSTISVAERILYMQSGRIVAEGTHEELLEKCDEYRELYSKEVSSQTQDEEI